MPSIRKRWPSHISLFIYSNRNRRWRMEPEKNGQWNYSIGRLHSWMFALLDVSLSEIYVSQNSDFFSFSLSFAKRVRVRVTCVQCMVPWLIPILFVFSVVVENWLEPSKKKTRAEYCVRKGNAKNDPIFSTQPFIHCAVYCIRCGGHSTCNAVRSSPYTISHIMLVVYCQSFSIQFSFFLLLFVAFILSCCCCW